MFAVTFQLMQVYDVKIIILFYCLVFFFNICSLQDFFSQTQRYVRVPTTSVSDPDSFFTDPDPGFFPQSGSGSRQQKTIFSKAKTKFWEKFWFSTQKVGILFLFLTNQVGILLNRELLFGIILKNKRKS